MSDMSIVAADLPPEPAYEEVSERDIEQDVEQGDVPPGAASTALKPRRPGLILTDTAPADLLAEYVRNEQGHAVEPALDDYLKQPLRSPALTVEATHQQVGGAIAALLDGRVRRDPHGQWWAWDGTTWVSRTPEQVAARIKGLIGRPDAERQFSRVLIPYQNVKLTAELVNQLIASGAGDLDPSGNGFRFSDGTTSTTLPVEAHQWAESSDTAARIRTDLAGRRSVAMDTDFDTAPALINAQGTLIDLGQGIVNGIATRTLTRHDLVSRSMGAGFDPDATCPQWERFVREVMSATDHTTGSVEYDPERERFLQVLVGLTLLGAVREQVLVILHGQLGSNGKSVFMRTLSHLFGQYTATLPKQVLMEKRTEGHTTDLTLLKGARLAYTKETPRGRWDAETAKDLASSEELVARKMRQDNSSWSPTHTLWATTNNTPLVAAGEQAFWRRVLIVTFKQRWYSDVDKPSDRAVSIAPIDPELPEKLITEAPGILNWALDGLRMYYADGKLLVPQSVRDDSEAARQGSSLWAEFVANMIEPTRADTDTLEVRVLWKLWNAYREANSQHEKVAPTARKDLVTAFRSEVPSATFVGNGPGKRHVAEHFAGVRLTDSGKRWSTGLPGEPKAFASVTSLIERAS